MTFTKDNNPYSRGQARMKELAAEAKAAIEANAALFLSVLDGPATAQQRAQAQMLASLLHRASRLRDNGRSDLEVLRQAAELMRDVPFLRNSRA